MPWFSKIKNVKPANSTLKYNTYYKVEKYENDLVLITNHEDNTQTVEPASWCKETMSKPMWISLEEFTKLETDTQAYCITHKLGYYQSYSILNDKLIERFE